MKSCFVDDGSTSVPSQKTSNGMMIHEQAEDMPHLPVARFTRRKSDNALLAFSCQFSSKQDPPAVYISHDEGKNWQMLISFSDSNLLPSDSGAFLCTRTGTIILAFSNKAEKANWNWDPDIKDSPGATLPTYAARSTDGGHNWENIQRLHHEWTGANRDIIETRDGTIVFTSMKLRHRPGRHTVLTYRSENDGESWQPSNVIDLGGNGHHGGVSEATLTELNDGTLLKYIRTNWGEFWRALSADGGRSWHPYGPSGIDAASAPGALLRLADGRIALGWNRFHPKGKSEVKWKGGDGIWSAAPTSNFRHELSLSISEDEGKTWSAPVVIARNPHGEVSYPYLFEPEPGTLWVTAHRFGLKMQIEVCDIFD